MYNKESEIVPHNHFQFMDILFGFMPKMTYVNFGRNYFPPGGEQPNLGNGIQLWSGSTMAMKAGM